MVICDWLDVTHSIDDTPLSEVRLLLLSWDAEAAGPDFFRVGDGGAVKLEKRGTFTRVSLSGGAVSWLRSTGNWLSMLGLLASSPHRVTRLDAAYDVPVDGADVIAAMRRRFRSGEVRLGRKALKTTCLLAVRPDGRETGTWYAGHRSNARATARVYDKAWERLQKAGVAVPPCTRYEVTVKKDYGATLRDAAEPERLFWHVAAPALLEAPEGVPAWDAGWAEGWVLKRPEVMPAAVLEARVSRSAELTVLLEAADALGPAGRVFLARRVLRRLGVTAEGLEATGGKGVATDDTGLISDAR